MSDNEIIQQVLEGSTQMFSRLVDRYKDNIFSLAYRYIGNYSDAQDISQEVFINVYKNLRSYNNSVKFSTWLYRIALNKSIDWYRKKKRKSFFNLFGESSEIENVESDVPSLYEMYENTEEQKALKKAVEHLDEKYRMVIVMFYYQQLSYYDIAEIMRLPVRTVETRMYRGKKLLQKEMIAKGYGGELYEAGRF